jgi:hypothetical protein
MSSLNHDRSRRNTKFRSRSLSVVVSSISPSSSQACQSCVHEKNLSSQSVYGYGTRNKTGFPLQQNESGITLHCEQ